MGKLNSLIGMTREKQKARMIIKACLISGEIFPHTLIYSIGGLGKTAFARAVGHELGCHFVEVEAINFKNRDQLLAFLKRATTAARNSGHPLLLFIDEIHRLKLPLQEALYIPMKEWRITTTRGDVKLPKFTLIGATTRFDMLDPNSFVTRFENQCEIQRYSEVDIGMIVAQEFRNKQLGFTWQVVDEVAKRCLGIPRIAISFVKKVMFSALSAKTRNVSLACVTHMFELEQIDSLGLHPNHRRYLNILDKAYPHPVGLGAISSKMRQPDELIKDAVEPILLELDFVASTPRGRVLTKEGSDYLENNTNNG